MAFVRGVLLSASFIVAGAGVAMTSCLDATETAGSNHTCALINLMNMPTVIKCWGENEPANRARACLSSSR